MQKITDMLFELQDTGYRDFHSKLVPGVDKERIIGVRTPALRKLAKEIAKMPEYETFLMETPHFYYEENNLHGMLIGLLYKDPAQALDKIDDFLPYVDNWATCDMLPPKCLARDTGLLRSTIVPWLNSKETYRVRFAIVAMLQFLLDDFLGQFPGIGSDTSPGRPAFPCPAPKSRTGGRLRPHPSKGHTVFAPDMVSYNR